MEITFNMATIPSRFKLALKAIDSVYDQADKIRIYLNNFEQVPEELNRDKIVTHIGEDLNAAGKLFWALNPNEYYFCIDDDIRYPSTYVKDMLKNLNFYNDKIFATLHGKILKPTPVTSYFKGWETTLHCLGGFDNSTFINIVGTGVCAFNTNNIKIDVSSFTHNFTVDIETSLQLQSQKIPSLAIAHSSSYLKYEEPNNIPGVKTLYTQHSSNDKIHTEKVNSISWKVYAL